MTRRKVKLAWIMNESARKASLKKRRLGLIKKVNELTILCDLRACLIVFSPDEAEPVVWPSPEVARGLIDRFFALPDIERNKKAMNQETYLKERIGKLQEQLVRIQKKNKEAEMDHLMYSLGNGLMPSDLHVNEMQGLIWYSKEKMILFHKRAEFILHPPLHNPPHQPNVAAGGGAAAAVATVATTEAEGVAFVAPTVSQSDTGASNKPVIENQNRYLIDQWIFNTDANTANQVLVPAAAGPSFLPQTGTGMMPYQENPYYGNLVDMGLPVQHYGKFLGGQASNSNANPYAEMELISRHPLHGSFRGLLGVAPQPTDHGSMNMNPHQGNMNMGGEIHTGLGLQPQGGGVDQQVMLRNRLGLYPHNFMGCEPGLIPYGGGGEGSSQRHTELGLQPLGSGAETCLMGANLRLQPHGHEGESSMFGGGQGGSMVGGQPGLPFGLLGGESNIRGSASGSSGIGAAFDSTKTWPNNNNNEDSSN